MRVRGHLRSVDAEQHKQECRHIAHNAAQHCDQKRSVVEATHEEQQLPRSHPLLRVERRYAEVAAASMGPQRWIQTPSALTQDARGTARASREIENVAGSVAARVLGASAAQTHDPQLGPVRPVPLRWIRAAVPLSLRVG